MKKRLDLILVEKNLAPSREKARAFILEGLVYVNGQKEDKAGSTFDDAAKIEVRDNGLKYVSRGGLKLEKAMETWPIDLSDAVSIDIGASTGGFTDCMLQNGAKKVYAVDVGYGQLAWSLRNDPRVVNLEKTNARNLSEKEVPERVDFISIDVSFISLDKILGPAKERLKKSGAIVALIKPQFEAGRSQVGKNGVVREKETHLSVLERVVRFANALPMKVEGVTFSPVKGPKGNIEYLMYLRNEALAPEEEETLFSRLSLSELVNESHELL